jgi:hypothetical protein
MRERDQQPPRHAVVEILEAAIEQANLRLLHRVNELADQRAVFFPFARDGRIVWGV